MTTQLGNINLFVRDVERAVTFYVEVLGLELDEERSVPPAFALLHAGGPTLTLQDASAPEAAFAQQIEGVELGFAVEDVEATRQQFEARGLTAESAQQMGWGSGFNAVDLDGHRLTIYRMRDEA